MARDFRELAVWQLADELRRAVIAFTSRSPVSDDRRFCDQIRDAADSVTSNSAEGFRRRNDGEFIRLFDIARGSLGEVQDRLDSASHREYVSRDTHERLLQLFNRALGANIRLTQYLERSRRRRDPRKRRG